MINMEKVIFLLTTICVEILPAALQTWNIGILSEYESLQSTVVYKGLLSAGLFPYWNQGLFGQEMETARVSIEDTFAYLPNQTSFNAISSVCDFLEQHNVSALISYASCYSSNALVAQTNSLNLPHIMLGANGDCSFDDENLHHMAPVSTLEAATSTFREIFPFFSSNDNNGANQVRRNKTASKTRLFTVSLSGTTDLIEEPLIDFIVMRNWTRLVLVHDNTMSNGFDDARNARFRRKLAQTNVFRYEIDTSKKFQVDLETELSTFNNSHNFENFVVIASEDNCVKILETAAKYNMFRLTFTWVLACPDSDPASLKINQNSTFGTIVLFKPDNHISLTNSSDLNKSFDILRQSFRETKVRPQKGVIKCDYTKRSTWTNGPELMNKINKYHKRTLAQLRQNNLTNFNLYVFNTQSKHWQLQGTWSRSYGFDSSNELFRPPTQNFKRIKVVTVVEPPFVEMRIQSFGPNFTGYCIDMLDEIAKQMNFQYDIYNASEYGRLNGNTWVGAVGEVAYKRADIAVSGMLITSMREDAVDFSTRFMDYGVGILIRKSPSSQTVFGFLEPLNAEVWTCVAGTIFLAGSVMYLVTRVSPATRKPTLHGEPPDISKFTLHNSIWFTMTSIMQQGGDLHPSSTSTRLLGSFWWFFTLIITATYTANLAAFLTVNRMETPIDSLQHLVAQNHIKYGTVRESPIHLDFKDQSEMNILYERIATYFDQNTEVNLVENPEDGYRKVREGNYAFMWDDPILQWMKAINCDYMTVGKPFLKKGYGIAVQKGTTFREEISKTILKLQESGTLEKLRKKWFEQPNSCPMQETSNKDNGAKGIELTNVAGIFYVLIFGTLLAFTVGVFEIFWHRRSQTRHTFAHKPLSIAPRKEHLLNYDNEMTETSEFIANSFSFNSQSDLTSRLNSDLKNSADLSTNDLYQISHLSPSLEPLEGLPDGCTLKPNGEIILPPKYSPRIEPRTNAHRSPVNPIVINPASPVNLRTNSENNLFIHNLHTYKAAIAYSMPSNESHQKTEFGNYPMNENNDHNRQNSDEFLDKSNRTDADLGSCNGIFKSGIVSGPARYIKFRAPSKHHYSGVKKLDQKRKRKAKEATV
ncbi:glutamate receptor ionotropic, delta-1-like isoform X2 [Convolutriloba macropyga]|uniref:glutamate receptor ionotropic, delta-1-like isoform X2 n=1 Tax=Convolutriloba macropyga TaxID=536237 RepID=UPI003F5246FA